MNNVYYIGSGQSLCWIKTCAKTLRGAKRMASQVFSVSHNNKLSVGQKSQIKDNYIVVIAEKQDYQKWANV